MFSSHKYGVEEVGLDIQIESLPRVNSWDSPRARLITQFARGAQAKVQHKKEEKKVAIFDRPATAFDWLKQLIIEWQPSLNFGWLIPETIVAKVVTVTEINEAYYNVIPVGIEDRRKQVLELIKQKPIPKQIDVIDWLEGEPITKEDIGNARRDYEEKLSSSEMAWYMRF